MRVAASRARKSWMGATARRAGEIQRVLMKARQKARLSAGVFSG